MKKIILTTVITISLLLNVSASAFADEIQTSTVTPATEQTTTVTPVVDQTGIATPTQEANGTNDSIPDIETDSPLYFLRGVFENVELFLTFDETAKTKLLEEIADERLEDLKQLDAEKQKELAQEITKVYEKTIEKLTYIAEKRKAEGKEVLDVAAILERAAVKAADAKIDEEVKTELDEAAQKAQITAAVVKDINPEIVNSLREKGYGYGKIAILVGLSEKSGKSIDEVIKALEENKGIGKTAKSLGVKPGDFKNHKKGFDILKNEEVKDNDEQEQEDAIVSEDKGDRNDLDEKYEEIERDHKNNEDRKDIKVNREMKEKHGKFNKGKNKNNR